MAKSRRKDPADKKPPGRKKTPLNWDVINRMLIAGCEGTAIALTVGVHPDTLYDQVKARYNTDFSAYALHKKTQGKELLRSKQFELALKGDRTMLVWLGKNVLDQKDRSEMAVTQEEAKDNFMILLPDDGRSNKALAAKTEDAVIIPPEDEIQANEQKPNSLFE